MLDSQTVKSVMTATTSAIIAEPIKIVIQTWLTPKIDKLLNMGKISFGLEHDIITIFAEYLNRTYAEEKSVNVLALGLQQVKLDEVYIPLRIFTEGKKGSITINKFDLDFVEQFQKIVIEDTAGMGKTTLMKKLFTSAIEQNIRIPIFIELRNLVSDRDIVDEIAESVNSINCNSIGKDLVRELISTGDFIFFLDGYDEIAFQHKQGVTKNLLKFISKARKNIFILTSRHDDSLACFGQFQKFEIDNLKNEEAFELFEKYDSITGLNIKAELVHQISSDITANSFSELKSFLGNPLLASLLYLTFKYKRDIPSSKIDFYRKVYDALYESHDLSKSSYKRHKYSGLSCGDFQKILMKLGFLCLRENVNDYTKDKLLELINQAKNSPYYSNIPADAILKDLIETVPLMTCIGLNYKWSHKSFMEYFSALFIDSKINKEEILKNIFASQNFIIYINMLDFYYELNRQLFDKIFIYPVLKKYLAYIERTCGKSSNDYELLYFEILYNRCFYISDFIKSNDTVETTKGYKLIRRTGRRYMPCIDAKAKDQIISIYIKDNKVDTLTRLLSLKSNNLITYITAIKGKQEYLDLKDNNCFCFEDNNQLSLDTIQNRILFLSNIYGVRATIKDRRSLLYIDYQKAKEYLLLIEEEIKRREEDIFSNL
jgi:hypothetical protein